jgi:hypothetical protein
MSAPPLIWPKCRHEGRRMLIPGKRLEQTSGNENRDRIDGCRADERERIAPIQWAEEASPDERRN